MSVSLVSLVGVLLQQEHDQVDILPAGDTGQQVEPQNRITTPYMTKYERARVLGTRALQIAYVLLLHSIWHHTGMFLL